MDILTQTNTNGQVQQYTKTLNSNFSGDATVSTVNDDGDFWLNYPAGEYGNSLCFRRVYGDRVAYNSAYGWMFNDGRKWLHGDPAESEVDKAAIETLLDRQRNAARRNSLIVEKSSCTTRNISSVKSLTRPYVTITEDQFDNEPNLLNTRSGVIDLRTGNIVCRESGRFTYCIDADYDREAQYTRWLEFLNQTVDQHSSNDGMREYLQMAFGYSLTGSTREECMFYLYGPTRSGKGTIAEVMFSLLGNPLSASAFFSTFTRHRDGNNFDLAPLKSARLVIASEGEKKNPLNEATVKTITGRDRITCAFKGKDEFSYVPNYKVWLLSNHPVAGDPDDDAFWNRVKVISCPWSKEGNEDKTLKEAMTQPEYLRGVLAYMVHGAKMWHADAKGLIMPDCVRQKIQEHRDKQDSVKMWLEDNTVQSGNKTFTANMDLFMNYENWCEENGYRAVRGKKFAETMAIKGYMKGKNEQGTRGYWGVSIKFD